MKPKRKSNRPGTPVPAAPFPSPHGRPGALAPDACPAPPPSAARRSLRRVRRAEDGLSGSFRSPNPCRSLPGDAGRCRETRPLCRLEAQDACPFSAQQRAQPFPRLRRSPAFRAPLISAPRMPRAAAPPSRPLRRNAPRTFRAWATTRMFSGKVCLRAQPLRPFFPTVLPLPDTIRPEES